MMKCLKTPTKAILVLKDGSAMVGRNWCTETKCGRPNAKSGQAYDKCHGIHAEEEVLYNALLYGRDGDDFKKMIINREPCTHCKAILTAWKIPYEVDEEMEI